MPIYEYRCKKCNRTYEELQSTEALKSMNCPDCGGLARRIISVPAKIRKAGNSFEDKYSIPEFIENPMPLTASTCPSDF